MLVQRQLERSGTSDSLATMMTAPSPLIATPDVNVQRIYHICINYTCTRNGEPALPADHVSSISPDALSCRHHISVMYMQPCKSRRPSYSQYDCHLVYRSRGISWHTQAYGLSGYPTFPISSCFWRHRLVVMTNTNNSLEVPSILTLKAVKGYSFHHSLRIQLCGAALC